MCYVQLPVIAVSVFLIIQFRIIYIAIFDKPCTQYVTYFIFSRADHTGESEGAEGSDIESG